VLPIAYVFQNKTTAVAQAELVKSILKHTNDAGLTVWGLTCDGAYTNISMMKILGCVIGNNYDEIKLHPITNNKVYFIPDACHNLNLARNTLGNCKVLSSDSGFIRWQHLSNLGARKIAENISADSYFSRKIIQPKNKSVDKYISRTVFHPTRILFEQYFSRQIF